MKTAQIVICLLILSLPPLSCGTRADCCKQDFLGYYYFYYKSATNADLLNPKTGIYKPDSVMIYEVVKQAQGDVYIPAQTNNGNNFKYVLNNGPQDGIYFVSYYCSILNNGDKLRKALIELKHGVTDTLTFSYSQPGNGYPEKLYYNGKQVWPPYGNNNSIIIEK